MLKALCSTYDKQARKISPMRLSGLIVKKEKKATEKEFASVVACQRKVSS
jgi:hypothetical protein